MVRKITIEIGRLAKLVTNSPMMVCVGKFNFGCNTNDDVLFVIGELLVKSPEKLKAQIKKNS